MEKTKGEEEMTNKNIIRAWRDAEFRNSLSESDRASLPANPAGLIELSDADLNDVSGGRRAAATTLWTCTMCLPCFGSGYGFAAIG
jgi:mersacidin/lichenicidin family type 2 lantibiotic